MGIFDIFSNSDAQNAAAAEKAGLTAGYNQLSGLYNQGSNALQTNYMAGLAPLLTNYSNSNAGVAQLMALLGINPPSGGGAPGAPAGGAPGGGTPAAGTPDGGQTMGQTAGATPGGAPATSLPYGPAAGGGGAPGGGGNNIQATLANLPGYQFALNQGTQNVLRNQSATGQLNSGATNVDLTNYGQGAASQNYNNYLQQLMPFLGSSNQNAAGIAGTYGNLGNALNSNLTTQGNAAYGTQAGIGNAQAQADYANLAQSGAIWGGLTGLASSALKLSDERVKDDIEPVGELFDGQTVYRYRYKGSPRHEIGLIAQEVEDRAPAAVAEFPGTRVKGVDYRRATNYAAELGQMLKAA